MRNWRLPVNSNRRRRRRRRIVVMHVYKLWPWMNDAAFRRFGLAQIANLLSPLFITADPSDSRCSSGHQLHVQIEVRVIMMLDYGSRRSWWNEPPQWHRKTYLNPKRTHQLIDSLLLAAWHCTCVYVGVSVGGCVAGCFCHSFKWGFLICSRYFGRATLQRRNDLKCPDKMATMLSAVHPFYRIRTRRWLLILVKWWHFLYRVFLSRFYIDGTIKGLEPPVPMSTNFPVRVSNLGQCSYQKTPLDTADVTHHECLNIVTMTCLIMAAFFFRGTFDAEKRRRGPPKCIRRGFEYAHNTDIL